jgi:hypothetical protein
LLPGATEVAFALGLADEVASVSHKAIFTQVIDKPVVAPTQASTSTTKNDSKLFNPR